MHRACPHTCSSCHACCPLREVRSCPSMRYSVRKLFPAGRCGVFFPEASKRWQWQCRDKSSCSGLLQHVHILSIIFPWWKNMMQLRHWKYAISCFYWKFSSNLKINFAVTIFKGQFIKVLNSSAHGDDKVLSSHTKRRKPEKSAVFPLHNAKKPCTLLCFLTIGICQYINGLLLQRLAYPCVLCPF